MMLVCKNCKRSNHPHYDKKYGGYCLECDNAGVPERDAKIAKMEAWLRQWVQAIEGECEAPYEETKKYLILAAAWEWKQRMEGK